MGLREELTKENIPIDIRVKAIKANDNELIILNKELEDRRFDLIEKRKIIAHYVDIFDDKDKCYNNIVYQCIKLFGEYNSYDNKFFIKKLAEKDKL